MPVRLPSLPWRDVVGRRNDGVVQFTFRGKVARYALGLERGAMRHVAACAFSSVSQARRCAYIRHVRTRTYLHVDTLRSF